jgi:cytoskeletal protein RodZ
MDSSMQPSVLSSSRAKPRVLLIIIIVAAVVAIAWLLINHFVGKSGGPEFKRRQAIVSDVAADSTVTEEVSATERAQTTQSIANDSEATSQNTLTPQEKQVILESLSGQQ